MNLVQKLSDNTKDYIDTFYKILDEMSTKMKEVEPSSSISATFIQQMIPHHEALIPLLKILQKILFLTRQKISKI